MWNIFCIGVFHIHFFLLSFLSCREFFRSFLLLFMLHFLIFYCYFLAQLFWWSLCHFGKLEKKGITCFENHQKKHPRMKKIRKPKKKFLEVRKNANKKFLTGKVERKILISAFILLPCPLRKKFKFPILTRNYAIVKAVGCGGRWSALTIPVYERRQIFANGQCLLTWA